MIPNITPHPAIEDTTLDDTPGTIRVPRPPLTARHVPVHMKGRNRPTTHEVVLLTGRGLERALVRRVSWPWVEISLYPEPSHGYVDPAPNEVGLYPPPEDKGYLDPNEIADAVITAYERHIAADCGALDWEEQVEGQRRD